MTITNPESTSSDGIGLVRSAIKQIDSGTSLSETQRTHILQELERYECWVPYFRLIKRLIGDSRNRRMDEYVRLAKAQNLYLEDVNAAADTCAQMVKDLKLPFATFRDLVLPKIIEFEDFAAEGIILQTACDRFPSKDDHVSCLERLCMIYEKKTHNETQLARTYEKLLATDANNIKALRYFKLAFTQNNEWADVVAILKTLMKSVRRPQELFRTAQELAAVLLYQMDHPEEAIKVLEEHCAESPLDTSTIHYDAYQRTGDADGCLRVLRGCLLNVNDDVSRSILHYKIGVLLEQSGQAESALENYQKSSRLWPVFLDPVEGAITLCLAKKDWTGVVVLLKDLSAKVQDPELLSQLRQASKRLENGLEHATE